ncbi:uncharacterized protein LOC125197088 [Salvia hispanica]|uniref:uncharacterized protein LOC125197088 n=1 Tax=Salvia hispanica TaxID=49212 RepID=UPI0020095B4F|nr:uncharacterized protein LOC125197088 [Salvia hispanica]
MFAMREREEKFATEKKKSPSAFSSLFFKRLKSKDSNGGARSWRRKSKSSTGFRWKRKFNFNLRVWFVDNVLFKIVSIFEAAVLVTKLCFFYLCCGCHF